MHDNYKGGRLRTRPLDSVGVAAHTPKIWWTPLNTWAKANTREDKKRDNMHDKCCEPTHPPIDASGKFLKFCELPPSCLLIFSPLVPTVSPPCHLDVGFMVLTFTFLQQVFTQASHVLPRSFDIPLAQ